MSTEREDLPEEIIQQACDYFCDFAHDRQNISTERWEEFQAWLDTDPRHRRAYQQFQGALDRFRDQADRVLDGPPARKKPC